MLGSQRRLCAGKLVFILRHSLGRFGLIHLILHGRTPHSVAESEKSDHRNRELNQDRVRAKADSGGRPGGGGRVEIDPARTHCRSGLIRNSIYLRGTTGFERPHDQSASVDYMRVPNRSSLMARREIKSVRRKGPRLARGQPNLSPFWEAPYRRIYGEPATSNRRDRVGGLARFGPKPLCTLTRRTVSPQMRKRPCQLSRRTLAS